MYVKESIFLWIHQSMERFAKAGVKDDRNSAHHAPDVMK